MSICPSCKAENPDSHQFCQFCGAKIAIDIPLNILGEEALQPSSVPTRPFNLESALETIKIQVHDLASSQLVSDIEEKSLDDSEDLEELPPEFNLEDFADINSETLMIVSSPVQLKDISYAGKTDVGIQRDRNEDDFVAIFQIICNANQAIFIKNENEKRKSLGRMGTTLVVLGIHDLDVVIAHVGDSRIYKVTNSPNLESESKLEAEADPKLEQITRDHEVLNQLIDLGIEPEIAQARPDAHQLTQALGPNPSDRLEPSIEFFTLTESTLFLLCSDGLCDNDAIDDNWRSHLLPILNKEVDLQTGLDRLIELGNNVNGHDNLTAILVLCELG